LTEDLTYDVFNNLIGVKVNGTQQRWTVFDGQNPYMDFDGSGTLTTRYLSNPQALDQLFGRVSAGGTVGWYITDITGSVREIISGNGAILDQINYDPFGQITYEYNSGNGDRFKFDSMEWDDNLKLYHAGDRWQDPVNGRWISQDPTSFAGGDANLYRFVGNGPASSTDLTGDGAGAAVCAIGVCAEYMVVGQSPGGERPLRLPTPPSDEDLFRRFFTPPPGIAPRQLEGGSNSSAMAPVPIPPSPTRLPGPDPSSSAMAPTSMPPLHPAFPDNFTVTDGAAAALQGVLIGLKAIANEIINEAINTGPIFQIYGLLGGTVSQNVITITQDDTANGYNTSAGAARVAIIAGETAATLGVAAPRRFTPDQDALIQLVRDAERRGGVAASDVSILKQWANEYGLPFRGPQVHPGRPIGQFPHIHVGPVNHVPVN
jgi:RHS repeat-associated protein